MKLKPNFRIDITKKFLEEETTEALHTLLRSLLDGMYDQKLVQHKSFIEVYPEDGPFQEKFVIHITMDKGYSEY